ncbi:MAG: deoxyuridine 5'-triphosphate nucleotidohydrolase [Candidatus Omnitrophica bacterium]|nr:deoxyuridine 5'-triphosphate nucleotidohydrolase [Candidatus Omnitrophota bacterium]MDD5429448.1 deoxyuridine 5'-triphosphate nucleotidohydrolase [Candidatus Omnitrophota bacterium]
MLNKKQISALIENKKLIENFIALDKQLTPNGFDLTAGGIFVFEGSGALDFSNSQRVVPAAKELKPMKDSVTDSYGWWELPKGAYKVKTNETVNLPNDLTALAFTRTSLLRMGAFTQHGVWDAGFRGKGEFILIVENGAGVRIKENARLAQLVFFPVEETQGYSGVYKGLV